MNVATHRAMLRLNPFSHHLRQVWRPGRTVSAMSRPEDACPHRVVDTAGSGFIIALVAAPYDAWRGAARSPRDQMVDGALRMLKTRTPARAGAFAIWGLVMSSYDCTFEALRGKRDPWNKIAAMGAVRGTLAIRAGPRVAILRMMEGAALWAIVEVAGLAIDGYFRSNVQAHGTPAPQGDEHVQLDRFNRRGEDGELLEATLIGKWRADTITEGGFPSPVEISPPQVAPDEHAAEQQPTRRLWIGGLALAATASAAHRYRLPLTQAANGAFAKFKNIS